MKNPDTALPFHSVTKINKSLSEIIEKKHLMRFNPDHMNSEQRIGFAKFLTDLDYKPGLLVASMPGKPPPSINEYIADVIKSQNSVSLSPSHLSNEQQDYLEEFLTNYGYQPLLASSMPGKPPPTLV